MRYPELQKKIYITRFTGKPMRGESQLSDRIRENRLQIKKGKLIGNREFYSKIAR